MQEESHSVVYLVNTNNDNDKDILTSVFDQVYIESDTTKAIQQVKEISENNHPTLFLIDLDAIKPSWFQTILADFTECVSLVVCSIQEEIDTLLTCVRTGAIAYLVRPFHVEEIHSLILKLDKKETDKTFSALYQRMALYNLSTLVCHTLPPTTPLCSLSKERTKELEENIHSWDFDPLDLNKEELVYSAYWIFSQLLSLPELGSLLSFSQDGLYRFIQDVADLYYAENRYHNFSHALDVLQCLFFMLNQANVHARPFTAYDSLALLIAAIGHDTGHPGVNNAFLVQSTHPLALIYNDQSVLENVHALTLSQLLYKYGLDRLLGNKFERFRKIIITSILATDMSHHQMYIDKLYLKVSESEKSLIWCHAWIKCADISNVARKFPISQRWSQALREEMEVQAQLESLYGLPVGSRWVLGTQVGFIRHVALDLFVAMARLCPVWQMSLDQLQTNLCQWRSLLDS
ncbi:hypothetical protein BY458DRAFT_496087 [Sporodiniella umbellata]|nr:hypothetical protein BY458DRAFT_496087 [Sporodiniella umbellata]